jgi:predicted nuclease of restriction endonuclease-like RecB superfamily
MISVRAVKPQGGRRADLGNQYFRSAWEANYARYLHFLIKCGAIKSWRYEPYEFKFPTRRGPSSFYKPDFEVTELNGAVALHEVKGWMDDIGRVKLKRMKKFYPEVKIIVIDQDCYRDIARKLARVIPGWE